MTSKQFIQGVLMVMSSQTCDYWLVLSGSCWGRVGVIFGQRQSRQMML